MHKGSESLLQKKQDIVCEHLLALVKTEQKKDTKNLCECLFSIVDCCLYVCKSFIAYVAHNIYNYILYRITVLKSVIYILYISCEMCCHMK